MRLTFTVVAWVCFSQVIAQGVEFTSSNLPIVIINTNGGEIIDDPKIVVDMGIIDNGPGNRNNLSDPHNVYDGKAAIEIRGSSSQMFPKKQYGFELRAADGEDDNETALFGMPKEGDWILFAPYNDKTLMRDALAYKLGRDMGNYASRNRFCELVLNGEYRGVYVFLEKVKRGKNRVNIDKLEDDENTGDDLTGGYILKIDKTTGGDEGGFVSGFKPENRSGDQSVYFQWEYPKAENITDEQKTYIKNYVNSFELALHGDDYNNPETGWTKYADMNSFIDYLIMNELTKNPDAYRLSTFLHKKKDSDGGKIYMGPIWDFNLGFGNVDYCTQGDPEGLVIDFNMVCPTDFWLLPFWWQKLWKDQTFRVALSERWTSLRDDRFSNGKILGYVDSVQSVLDAEAQQRNFAVWPVLGTYVWPNYQYNLTTYDAEVEWLKDWIEARLAYLDKRFQFSITGVNEISPNKLNVRAFPNPFDNDIFFQYDVPSGGITRIEVFDLMGRNLSTTLSVQSEGGKFESKTTLSASPGLYVYKVTHNNLTSTGRLLKK